LVLSGDDLVSRVGGLRFGSGVDICACPIEVQRSGLRVDDLGLKAIHNALLAKEHGPPLLGSDLGAIDGTLLQKANRV